MKDIEKAKSALTGDTSFSLVNGADEFTSKEHGVKPLLQLLDTNSSLLAGASIADRVIGRAAAMLMALGGVKEAYAEVISMPGHNALEQYSIDATFGELVANISNRTKTGLCPIEQSCIGIDDPSEAKKKIISAIISQKKGTN